MFSCFSDTTAIYLYSFIIVILVLVMFNIQSLILKFLSSFLNPLNREKTGELSFDFPWKILDPLSDIILVID